MVLQLPVRSVSLVLSVALGVVRRSSVALGVDEVVSSGHRDAPPPPPTPKLAGNRRGGPRTFGMRGVARGCEVCAAPCAMHIGGAARRACDVRSRMPELRMRAPSCGCAPWRFACACAEWPNIPCGAHARCACAYVHVHVLSEAIRPAACSPSAYPPSPFPCPHAAVCTNISARGDVHESLPFLRSPVPSVCCVCGGTGARVVGCACVFLFRGCACMMPCLARPLPLSPPF